LTSHNRVLEAEEITKLVAADDAKLLVKRKWPEDKEKRIILEALTNKKAYVTLKGIRFDIRYSGEDAFVSPVKTTGEFVPCGWFSQSGLEKELVGNEVVEETNGQKT
jgi:hypothetical protein